MNDTVNSVTLPCFICLDFSNLVFSTMGTQRKRHDFPLIQCKSKSEKEDSFASTDWVSQVEQVSNNLCFGHNCVIVVGQLQDAASRQS